MMKLEQQVVSLELAKKLKELGVKQESLFYWKGIQSVNEGSFYDVVELGDKKSFLGLDTEILASAFTVAELGERLNSYCETRKVGNEAMIKDGMKYVVYYELRKYHKEYADTEADARAKMLIYLLENSLLSEHLNK